MILLAIGVALLLAIVVPVIDVPVIVIVRPPLQQSCGGTGVTHCGGTARQAPRPWALSYLAFHRAATTIASAPIPTCASPSRAARPTRSNFAALARDGAWKNQNFAVPIGFDIGRPGVPASLDFDNTKAIKSATRLARLARGALSSPTI
jgi:hypothetical protein